MTRRELPIDDNRFCSWRKPSQSLPDFSAHMASAVSREKHAMSAAQCGQIKTIKLFVVGCLFHDFFLTLSRPSLHRGFFFFSFLLNCFDTFSTLYITKDCCLGSGCGRTHSFLFIPDFLTFIVRERSFAV